MDGGGGLLLEMANACMRERGERGVKSMSVRRGFCLFVSLVERTNK